jgi:hypothetical protein
MAKVDALDAFDSELEPKTIIEGLLEVSGSGRFMEVS